MVFQSDKVLDIRIGESAAAGAVEPGRTGGIAKVDSKIGVAGREL